MPPGEIPRHFQETGDNNALCRSSTTDDTLLKVFERHVDKEAQGGRGESKGVKLNAFNDL